ncbi:MAG: type II toxin-antitoxin system HicA family toxin [Terriglobales bacterium]
MATLPLLRPRDVVKALEKLGWTVVRQRGSHIILYQARPHRHAFSARA